MSHFRYKCDDSGAAYYARMPSSFATICHHFQNAKSVIDGLCAGSLFAHNNQLFPLPKNLMNRTKRSVEKKETAKTEFINMFNINDVILWATTKQTKIT